MVCRFMITKQKSVVKAEVYYLDERLTLLTFAAKVPTNKNRHKNKMYFVLSIIKLFKLLHYQMSLKSNTYRETGRVFNSSKISLLQSSIGTTFQDGGLMRMIFSFHEYAFGVCVFISILT